MMEYMREDAGETAPCCGESLPQTGGKASILCECARRHSNADGVRFEGGADAQGGGLFVIVSCCSNTPKKLSR